MFTWLRKNREAEDELPGPPGPGPDGASWLSRFSYSWLNPLIKRGAKRQLNPEDIWDIPETEAASFRESEFEEEYEKRKAARTEKGLDPAPSLSRVFIKLHRRRFIVTAMLLLVFQAYNLSAPSLIEQITICLGDPSISPGLGYMYVIILAFGQWIGMGVCQSHAFLLTYKMGISCRSALTAAVFKKSMNLSNSSRQSVTVGEIVNLMSNDTQRYVEVVPFVQQLWSGPFVIIVGLILLVRLVGFAALAGLGLMILTIPLQGKMFLWASSLRKEVMVHSDVRVKLMNEVLQGIKAIKLYAWEDPYEERIQEVRTKEIKAILKTSILRGINFAIFSALPSIIAIVVLMIYSAQGNLLAPEVVFPAIGYMNVLRFPLLLLPMLVTQLVQLKVSNKRLSALLEAAQMNEEDRNWTDKEGSPEGGRVEIVDGRFTWRRDYNDSLSRMKQPEKSRKKPQKKKRGLFRGRRGATDQAQWEEEAKKVDEVVGKDAYELKNINFTVEPGEFVAIVGAVGSGKSSLVSAMLGEISKLKGSVNVRGSVAYTAQTPWIFNDTVRSNITFGETYDDTMYSKTINSTALENDLATLTAGDLTEIGEKGINLSGGQKQRVSVARAVYTDADIYILDDPLSAVDAHVGEHMFRECFLKQLRKKTRILVTNQLQFLPYTDRIYAMQGGRIVDVGTFAELNREGTLLFQIMESFGATLQATVAKYDTEASEANKGTDVENIMSTKDMIAMKEYEKQDGHLVNTEARAHGGISQAVWLEYFRAGGGLFYALSMFVIYCMSLFSGMAPDLWLTHWSNQTVVDVEGTQALFGFYAGIYGMLGVIFGLLTITRTTAFAYFSTRAAKCLHNDMLQNVLRAPMMFFETTPLGRILNRFSKDTDRVDILLPPVMDYQCMLILNTISVYILVVVFLPWFLIALPFMLLGYWTVQWYYRRTSRELQRIESIQRSPIYAHLSESLHGTSTIRAYGRNTEACAVNHHKQDDANAAYYIMQVARRWLQFRLEVVSLFVLLAIGCLVVASRDAAVIGLNASQAGLLLTHTVLITNVSAFMVRGAVDLETKLTSVERQVEYSKDVEREAESIIPDNRPPDNWPNEGRVEFKGFKMRYRPELDLALKGVDLSVDPLWKVGIAGRTGSGKSSLTVSLFRLVEKAEGSILIDGIDISTIGLKDLRSKLGIIPQDPVIFSGTVRLNIDPLHTRTDAELWNVLELVQLKQVIANLFGGLDADVAEGGENFSQGQRQLFCIARAIIRNPKVLVMDEATANVDVETDTVVQKTIRSEFKGSTVLTIAHRINTIIDSDRVAVIDNGFVKEYESPACLLRQKSAFSDLVDAQQKSKGRRQITRGC
ncbi:hypothetical protein NDN08_001944 [Rhodosorus marinus]|uniref:Probable ATP-dependent transporter ycf16 n=1 Tax=Rhodosorus marinus TaxID=101924 RepID=A0AAV8UWL2_9RHOD|nr:hypothetical protein NDN08_001944 [Rhodosorus marinus]